MGALVIKAIWNQATLSRQQPFSRPHYKAQQVERGLLGLQGLLQADKRLDQIVSSCPPAVIYLALLALLVALSPDIGPFFRDRMGKLERKSGFR
jgi:hypothetical protein